MVGKASLSQLSSVRLEVPAIDRLVPSTTNSLILVLLMRAEHAQWVSALMLGTILGAVKNVGSYWVEPYSQTEVMDSFSGL